MAGHKNRTTQKGKIKLLTEGDLPSEQTRVDFLSQHFPADGILTEEAEGHTGHSGRTRILDPLDGTTNYAHGFPFYGVSIALEAEGDVVVGLVTTFCGAPCPPRKDKAVTAANPALHRAMVHVLSFGEGSAAPKHGWSRKTPLNRCWPRCKLLKVLG